MFRKKREEKTRHLLKHEHQQLFTLISYGAIFNRWKYLFHYLTYNLDTITSLAGTDEADCCEISGHLDHQWDRGWEREEGGGGGRQREQNIL